MSEPRPILVSGAHRSGTTWVGRMLAANSQTAYISEPLNVLHRPGVFAAAIPHWYTYIDRDNEADYLPAFHALLQFKYGLLRELRSVRSARDTLRMLRDLRTFLLGRMRGQRALIKDPFAIFSAPWFAERLNCSVVITVRHPAAFAQSLKRLNWPFDFRNLLAQASLMRDHLEADRAEMESMRADDIIGQAALLWRSIYRFVNWTRESCPDFKIVRHEELSRDPVEGFRTLYDSLGLRFDDRAAGAILNASNSDNPSELSKNKTFSVNLNSRASLDTWKKRLDRDEILRVRQMTESVWPLFYSDTDW